MALDDAYQESTDDALRIMATLPPDSIKSTFTQSALSGFNIAIAVVVVNISCY